jgi:hypothetical protein
LAATTTLHDELARVARRDPGRVRQALLAGDRALRQQDKSFNGQKDLPVALSALVLSPDDAETLRQFAITLHEIIERAMNWLWADPARLARHCPDQRRMFPYLRRTAGAATWQGYSRYDVVVDAAGQLHVIELNTGCPAGFMHAQAFTHATSEAITWLDGSLLPPTARSGTIARTALVSGLLAAEARAGITPGLVGLLTDENCLTHELDLLSEEFARRGRSAAVLDARDLAFRDGRLASPRGPLSLAYQKFRISVPTSENHCWREGFEQRYAALLAAIQADAIVAVNNLAALCVSEDKSLLGLLAEPEVLAELTPIQRQFVHDHVIQRFVEPATLPVISERDGQIVVRPMFLTLGLGVVEGAYCGVLSRISPNRVTNVAREGIVQGVVETQGP